MPKIAAATVAEHHAAQRRALLDAARAVLATGQIPTLTEIAARTGLARPSVYQYFRSRDDLLLAVFEDAFPRWSARTAQRMDAARDPAARVLAYAAANIDLVEEGEHAVARALATVLPGEALAERARDLHQRLEMPLVAALEELGAPEPEATAGLVNAVVHAAAGMVESGADPAAVRARVEELLGPYLGQRLRATRRGHAAVQATNARP
ncbi:TetR/AcrR family transcriptional regulator [Nocardia thailandica]|uniref:TetR/AcrR family transcriptional regulator n=1 Tax=Nocardia thailandica TaxID=257275 RepID=A0ABW6PTV1_9NOCA